MKKGIVYLVSAILLFLMPSVLADDVEYSIQIIRESCVSIRTIAQTLSSKSAISLIPTITVRLSL